MDYEIKERLQGWVDALDPGDFGWEECRDALAYIRGLEKQVVNLEAKIQWWRTKANV